jgi:RimJ/RimL family protein N-acetyltransferase
MEYYKRLIGEKCYLSPLFIEDAQNSAKWMNDMETSLNVTFPQVISLESRKQTFLGLLKEEATIFGIIDSKTDKSIGHLSLMNINHINGTADFGIVIGEKEYWNKGYGTEATKLILDYGFNLLNLHNIILSVYDFNKRAIASYLNIGFKEIGRRRGERLIAGKRYDTIFMDIISSEFESPFISKVMKRIL